ncbi:MAG: DUF3857 domain-containing protein [Planctomycetota bacterium]|jgi:transglutaminase-like putative cysteine protease/tetratricopeptide (TPR) repeat protein
MKKAILVLFVGLAVESFLAAAERSPLVEPKGRASAAAAVGWEHYLQGDLSKAELAFHKAVESDQGDHHAHFGLEMLASGRGEYEKGFAHALRAVESGLDSIWLELYLADAAGLAKYSQDPQGFREMLIRLLARPKMTRFQQLLLRLYLARTEERVPELSALPFLRSWQILGPFNNRERSGLDTDFGPEVDFPAVELKAKVPGRNRPVQWTTLTAENPRGYLDLGAVLQPGEESVGYAMTAIDSPAPTKATLIVGMAGAGALWVGDTQVGAWETYAGYHPLQRAFTVALPAGETRILIKAAGEREGELGFSCLLIPGSLEEGVDIPAPALVAKTIEAGGEQAARSAEKARPTKEKGQAAAGLDWGLLGHLRRQVASHAEPMAMQMALAYLYLDRRLDDRLHTLTRPLLETAAARATRWPPAQEFASLVQSDSNRARHYLETALKVHPEEIAAQELMVHLLQRGGFLMEAEALARRILEVRSSGDALEVLGDAAKERGWDAEANGFYRRALKQMPGEGRLYGKAASTAKGRVAREQWLQRGVDRTRDADLEVRLIRSRLTEAGNEKELEKRIASALVRRPYSARLWTLAVDQALAVQGVKGALAVLDRALTALPQSASFHRRQGELLLQRGMRKPAAAAWRTALAIKPDTPALREYLQEIEPRKARFYDAYRKDPKGIIKDRVDPADHPRYNMAVLLDQGVVHAHPNGTRDMMVHFIRQALTPQGAKRMGRYSLPFDPERERIEVLAARVIQPDGSTLSATKIRDRTVGGGGGEGVIYNRGHVKDFTFPQVREGSVVEIQYVMEATGETVYGNIFEDAFYFGGNEPTLHFEYVLDTPESLAVQVATHKADAVKAVFHEERVGGRHRRIWRTKNIPGFEMEPGMPPYSEIAPAIRASTFADWNAVGAWYWQLSKESMTLPEGLKKKALELTAGATSDEEKLAAIYYFIIDTVRYVGIEFGRNGYVPHSCERTVTTRYGDCKDTAVLFVAMLKAVAIDARVALVRTWDRGVEPTGLPGARRFNHAIAYVPDLNGRDYWMDGTTDYNAFGELPLMDQGAMALITGPDGGRRVTIPQKPATANAERQRYTVRLDANGDAVIDLRIQYHGAYAPGYRRIFDAPDRLKKGLEFYFKRQFPGASMSQFTTSGSDLRGQEVFFALRLTVPGFAKAAGGQWKCNPWLMPGRFSQLARQNERKNDLLVNLIRSRQIEATLILPAQATVESVPGSISEEQPFGKLTRARQTKGREVRLTLDAQIQARRIKLKTYDAFRRFTHRLDSAEKEWVVYSLPKVEGGEPKSKGKSGRANDQDEW